MADWNIVAKDGNPEKSGIYLCVLIHPIWDGDTDTGVRKAEVSSRYFGDAKKYSGWVMDDQPDTGLVWTEQSGSILGESVYAWMKRPKPEVPELPDGVIWEDPEEWDYD